MSCQIQKPWLENSRLPNSRLPDERRSCQIENPWFENSRLPESRLPDERASILQNECWDTWPFHGHLSHLLWRSSLVLKVDLMRGVRSLCQTNVFYNSSCWFHKVWLQVLLKTVCKVWSCMWSNKCSFHNYWGLFHKVWPQVILKTVCDFW